MPNSAPVPAPAPANASSDDKVWTIRELLDWTRQHFEKKQLESPRLDAELLLAHVLGYDERVKLYMHYGDSVGAIARDLFRGLIKRRLAGEPVARLVGKKEFRLLTIQVTPAVLSPRPETELLVDEFIKLAKTQASPRIADIGTGSGCIALACAREHKTAQLWAVDVSPTALETARANAKANGLTDRVVFLEGSLLEPLADQAPFDYILSNPPYIPTSEIASLEPSVRDYDPKTALDGGSDGLQWIRGLVEQAPKRLKSGGTLIFEIGFDQESPVRELLADPDIWENLAVVRDLAGHPRIIRVVRCSTESETETEMKTDSASPIDVNNEAVDLV